MSFAYGIYPEHKILASCRISSKWNDGEPFPYTIDVDIAYMAILIEIGQARSMTATGERARRRPGSRR